MIYLSFLAGIRTIYNHEDLGEEDESAEENYLTDDSYDPDLMTYEVYIW